MLYATEAQAASFWAARLDGSLWDAVSAIDKPKALQSASDAIDVFVASRGGWYTDFDASSIPVSVTQACCFEALELIRPDGVKRRRLQLLGVRSIAMGSTSESYASLSSRDTLLSTRAVRLLSSLTKTQGSGVTIF